MHVHHENLDLTTHFFTDEMASMRTRSAIISIFLVFASVLTGQNSRIGSVKGLVVDELTSRPLEFVSAALCVTLDSAILIGKSTDKAGRFEFSDLLPGEYFLRFDLIGYERKTIPSFEIDSQHRDANLGQIGLVTAPVKLDEVVVTGQRALYNNSVDRKVYNIDQDLMSKAGSASELLQNVPSIDVDIDGNVTLRGSSNVLIMINGKSSPLLEKNSATVLQQMPASSIEKVEIITNPSAKYKPDGTAGIINLVLKKNGSLGINGNLTANAGNQDRVNGNVRLNYNPGGFNIFGSYSIRKDSRNRVNSDKRTQIDSSSAVTLYDGTLNSFARPFSHLVSAGLDYKISSNDELGFSSNYFYNGFTRTEDANNVLRDAGNSVINQYDRLRVDDQYEKEYSVRAYIEHAFPGEDHKLRFEASISRAPEQENNHYTNSYAVPAIPNEYDNTLIKNTDDKDELTVEYQNPLSEQSSLEAGYVGQFNSSDLDYFAESFDPGQGRFVTDFTRTNRFQFDETIHALYTTYKRSFGNFGLLAGLRGEKSHVKAHLVTFDSTLINGYFKIYPTLHLSYKLSTFSELQLSYSRRTHRPEADDLNPFPEYRDPRNVSAGNPKLQPEFSHSVELGCQIQTDEVSLLPALFYRYTFNRFTTLTQAVNDTLLLTTRQNLSNDQSGGVELVASANVGELVSMHWSGNAFLNQIDASNLGYGQKKTITTWSSNFTATMSLTTTSKFQVNANYNSARLTPQGQYSPSYVVNVGLRQELFDGKLSCILTVADVFKTLKRELQLDIPSLKQSVVNMRDSRILYFGFTYYFGAPPKKSKDEQLKYDDGI